MDEFLAKAQRRKVRKGSCENLSSLAVTETMINPETGGVISQPRSNRSRY